MLPALYAANRQPTATRRPVPARHAYRLARAVVLAAAAPAVGYSGIAAAEAAALWQRYYDLQGGANAAAFGFANAARTAWACAYRAARKAAKYPD